MPIEISSILSAAGFSITPLIAVMLFSAILSGIFVFVNKYSPPKGADSIVVSSPSFGEIFMLSNGFGGFGYILGFFIGVSHDPLTVAVLGTVTTSGTTFLAMLYGKDAISNSLRILPCALISMFFGVVITMEYGKIALGG